MILSLKSIVASTLAIPNKVVYVDEGLLMSVVLRSVVEFKNEFKMIEGNHFVSISLNWKLNAIGEAKKFVSPEYLKIVKKFNKI